MHPSHFVGPSARSAGAHALARSHDLVHEQKLLGEGGGNVQPILLGDVVVVDLLFDGRDGAQRGHVQSHRQLVLVVLVLQQDDRLLDVVAAVLRQHLG